MAFCPGSLKYKRVPSDLSGSFPGWEKIGLDWTVPQKNSVSNLFLTWTEGSATKVSLFVVVSVAEKFKSSPRNAHWPARVTGLSPLTFFVMYLVIIWTSCCVLSFGWGWSYSLSADTKGMIVPNHRKEHLNRWGQTQNKATNSRMCFETWNNISPFSFQKKFHAR